MDMVVLCHMEKAVTGFIRWLLATVIGVVFPGPHAHDGRMWVKDGRSYPHGVSLKTVWTLMGEAWYPRQQTSVHQGRKKHQVGQVTRKKGCSHLLCLLLVGTHMQAQVSKQSSACKQRIPSCGSSFNIPTCCNFPL